MTIVDRQTNSIDLPCILYATYLYVFEELFSKAPFILLGLLVVGMSLVITVDHCQANAGFLYRSAAGVQGGNDR